MQETIKSVTDKISSYNIFNNLLPGIIFCALLQRTTRFNLSNEDILSQLFIWYFTGMVLSRIGSIYVERILKAIKIKKQKYVVFADYNKYVDAAKVEPFIKTLSETNNTYRTIISVLVVWLMAFIYDCFLRDWLHAQIPIWDTIAIIVLSLFLILLFIRSYKKQTDYINKLINHHSSNVEGEQ